MVRLTILPRPPVSQALNRAFEAMDEVLTDLEHAQEMLDDQAKEDRYPNDLRYRIKRQRLNMARRDALHLKSQLAAIARNHID